MRLVTPARLLITAATVAASLSTLAVAPSVAAAAARRGFADSPADAGYVSLHAHPASYTVKAHQQIAVALQGVPSGEVAGVSVGLTVQATGAGAVTLWQRGTKRPSAVTAAFVRGTLAAGTVVAPGPLSLLNSSGHSIKVVLVVKGYFPTAERAFASGAPGWFVPAAAKKAVSVRMPAHTTSTYNALLAAPPHVAAIVLAVAATGTKKGQLKGFAFHSAYTTHTALSLLAGKRTSAIEVLQPSGASHLVGLSNLSAGSASVTASAVGYVKPFHTPTQAQYVRATAGVDSATVTWQSPVDAGGLPITSYLVRVYPNGPTQPSDGTVTTVTGLSARFALHNGHNYWFGVTGVNAAGPGAERTTDFPANPTPATVPAAPQHLTAASSGVGQVTLHWTAPVVSPETPLTSYTITGLAPAPVTVASTATSAVIPMPSGTSAIFSVTADNADGSSLASSVGPVTVLGVPDTRVTTRVSTALDPAQSSTTALAFPETPAVSAGGRYVAFGSDASNLVVGDTNDSHDIFVRDLVTGTTTRVSVSSDGAQGDDDSFDPVISADGRFVAFDSYATTLTPQSWDGQLHVYWHDLQTGETRLVSIDTLGFQADGSQPSISADGNKVAFVSTSGRLTSGYPGGAQVYVRDMSQAVTVLASDGVDGHESNGMCEVPVISADGDHVVFDSYASNLVPGVPNGWEQVFERDLATSTTTWVSQSLSGQPDDDSYYSSVSANGRMVAFESRAGNLVSGDTNDAVDVFVRDMQAGVTSRISLATGGAQTAGDTGFRPVSISASGERVAFTFYEAGLVPNETAVRVGTFVHDMVAGTTTETSVASDGSATASGADAAALSPDGAFQAFEAVFTGATQVDRSSSPGVFLRRLG